MKVQSRTLMRMPKEKKKRHGILFHIFDVVLNIVIILAIVGVIRTFLVSPFQVEGNSMVSTLQHKEYIIINKLAYHIGEPERGDVVVFRPPTDPSKHYVKRVIGVPGDTVTVRDGKVFLIPGNTNNASEIELPEDYLNDRNNGKTYKHPPSSGNMQEVSYQVEPGGFFLMGDNRQGSLDSRSFMDADNSPIPFVPSDDIKGKVWFVALPITKLHALEIPNYGI